MKSGILVFLTALALVVLTPLAAAANDFTFKYGKSMADAPRMSKVFGLGVNGFLNGRFAYSVQADMLNTPSNPHKIAYVIGPSIGPEVWAGGVFARAVWGPALLTHRDADLGGNFQFNQDFTVGLRDSMSSIGLGYKHISSAGFYKPNRGKDYMYLVLGFRF